MSVVNELLARAAKRVEEVLNIEEKKKAVEEVIKSIVGSESYKVSVDYEDGVVRAVASLPDDANVKKIVDFITHSRGYMIYADVYVITRKLTRIISEGAENDIDLDRLSKIFEEFSIFKEGENKYKVVVPLQKTYPDVYPYLVISFEVEREKDYYK